MPYKCEKMKLSEEQDRRVKLTKEKKVEIRKKYDNGGYSMNQLAREYNVSKKTILLIVNDESKKKNDERVKNTWKYYQKSKEERNEVAREHRRYKNELYKKGELK
ncbi:MAG: helix-turn-helix domain-containing protein [Bacilli bacterium]